jgi:hypothetical protein
MSHPLSRLATRVACACRQLPRMAWYAGHLYVTGTASAPAHRHSQMAQAQTGSAEDINAGRQCAWTNMSIEHTARTGADKGYVMVIPEDGCSTMNAEWHRASIEYAMQNVAAVTTTAEVLRALGGR